ncbi:hypothetical protein BT69DRAFT_1221262 [Atractiella rhizophila]|nr:hypothetical protein BT69DRAFT_1221262 [Atractiella rhizophila]
MPFGQVVIGPPGAGKSTYCHGMHQFLSALHRPVTIVNLDPANEILPYPCDLSISELITLPEVMQEFGLGPNGSMLYCMEFLEKNFDWLEDGLNRILTKDGKHKEDGYVIFDVAGQVELSTNHDSLKHIIERLGKLGYRLAAVNLNDAHYVTDASKYVSVVLLSLRTMLHLELPHVNVLSKIDLVAAYGELPFNLEFYTEVQDLSYLRYELEKDTRLSKYSELNRTFCDLIEDFSLVGFETLCVEDKKSMLRLLRVVDQALGYVSPPHNTHLEGEDHHHSHFSSVGMDPADFLYNQEVQEKWVDYPDVYRAQEMKEWREEGARAQMEETQSRTQV